MSSAKGSGAGRTRAQAYQNSTAFRHNKGSKKTAAILATAHTGGLCDRCADKIEWRKKYRKYKPLTQPRKCNSCSKKNVKAAYRTLCDACAKEKKVCSMCAQRKDQLNEKPQTKAEEAREYEFLEGVVESMRERERRSVYRKVARGENVLAPYLEGSSSEDEADEGTDVEDSEADEEGDDTVVRHSCESPNSSDNGTVSSDSGDGSDWDTSTGDIPTGGRFRKEHIVSHGTFQ